ncbi:MAG: 30S ribosomal protein S13 [Candidatus Saccharimonadales bacterium]|nr:30S ribosomal protein S13 [Candidatus Saccharimonadales bacterium]
MARIGGVTIPINKRVVIALTYIYGIGLTTSQKILKESAIDPNTRVKDLTEPQLQKIRDYIGGSLAVEGELQRVVSGNVKRLKDIGTYRGVRHKNKLPARGQRTRTNARTKRGKKVTVGGIAQKAASKT